MTVDLNRILALFDLVKKSSEHPTLAPLGQLAMKELQTHSADAKKDHDKILAKEKEDADVKQLEEFNKRQAAAKAAEAQTEDTKPTPSWEPTSRRQVTEEQANG